MFDTICTLPLSSDLFAQALHPSEPLLTVGLSSGHVQTFRLPNDLEANDAASSSDDDDVQSPPLSNFQSIVNGEHVPAPIISRPRRSSSASESGLGSIDTVWRTRRHKGSCRCLTYSHDGIYCYSAGTDGLVKAFETETGRVVSKIGIPQTTATKKVDDLDSATILHALSPQTLLLGTDTGKLFLYDLRQQGREMATSPAQTWNPHGDEHVNALVPLPVSETSTSGFPKQWVSVGGTTLAVTDMRKGVIATSEDQEVELTSVTIISGLKKGGTNVGEKVLVGQGDGVVSLWERGVWGDLDERIVLDRAGLGVDAIAEVPLGFGRPNLKVNEKICVTGLEDGRVRFLRIGRNGVLPDWDIKHDDLEGVVAVGFDVAGRLVTGGGQTVKVWTEAKGLPGGSRKPSLKHDMDSDEDAVNDNSDADSDDDDSEDDKGPKSKRKKRKRNKGKDKSGGQALNFSGLF